MTASDRLSPELARLTGVRSGKRSYYRALVQSDERLQQAVRAMDSISRAVVRTTEGPQELLEQVVRTAAEHLQADWAVLALSDQQLPSAWPRFVAFDESRRTIVSELQLPAEIRHELGSIRAGSERSDVGGHGWVSVPMWLEGTVVGSLVARHHLPDDPEPADLSVLRILANHAAVSLHTSEQYQASLALHSRAQRLYDETTAQARDLAERTAELRTANDRLQVARQRELIETERARIARELHDSVTQYVLSAGMAVEVARGEAELLGDPASTITDQLMTAKRLSQEAVEQLRRAIYALSQSPTRTVSTLPELLNAVAEHHRPRIDVQLSVSGPPERLGADADHEVARAVGEALFNVASHARATRAVIRLRYRRDMLLISVADDGQGDPVKLSRLLRLERGCGGDGRHRGLANIESRIREFGGSLAFRRARIGGVQLLMRIPRPICQPDRPTTIAGLVTDDGDKVEGEH